ncbi:MAG: hypothetical protein IJ719_14660 [Clostridia bacterium]|nr:hypothetical protein [Clostridia bacterium]
MGKRRKHKKHRGHHKREEFENYGIESDEYFAYIVGYTAGGAPYGITWEEQRIFDALDAGWMTQEYDAYLEYPHNDEDGTFYSDDPAIIPLEYIKPKHLDVEELPF